MAGFDFSCKNVFMVIVYVVLGYLALRVIQNNCDIGLGGFFKTIEGFVSEDGAPVPGAVMAAEESSNAGPQVVQGLGRTPSTCYPQPTLKAEDLLPREDSAAIQEFNIARPAGEGILEGVNMLDAGFHVGVNTVGQSLRNANRQLRAEPPNPQVAVSPFLNTTIGPDLMRRPLEDGEGCAASPQGPTNGSMNGPGAGVGASPVA